MKHNCNGRLTAIKNKRWTTTIKKTLTTRKNKIEPHAPL